MTFDFFATLGIIVIAFLAGCICTWYVMTHPNQADAWAKDHLHAVYSLYHPTSECPNGYTCQKQ